MNRRSEITTTNQKYIVLDAQVSTLSIMKEQ